MAFLEPQQSMGFRALVFMLVMLSVSTVSLATAFRIDDRGTMVSTSLTVMHWRKPVPGRIADNTAEGIVDVRLQLDLQKWVGRSSRIYMVSAPAPLSSVIRTTWSTQGRMLPGNVLSGQRAVVFEGVVPSGTFVERMQLQLVTDGRDLTAVQTLQFYFEIELL